MTNTFKEDVAVGVATNLENAIAEAAQGLLAQREQAIGARNAFRIAQDRLRGLSARADAMMDEGALSPDERKAWKRALELAHGSMESLYQTSDVSVHELDGQAKAFNAALRITSKHKTSYLTARQAILQAEAEAEAEDAEGQSAAERSAPLGIRLLRQRDIVSASEDDDAQDTPADRDGAGDGEPLTEDGVAAPTPEQEIAVLLANFSRPELQKEASALGLKSTGNKEELARRIIDGRNSR